MNTTLLIKRGLLLEYLTLGWNVVGVVIVILTAVAACSVALAGFGLDSLIEIFASVVVVWQLTGVNLKRERLALRLIGIAFVLLVIYILAQLAIVLLTGTHAVTSIGGTDQETLVVDPIPKSQQTPMTCLLFLHARIIGNVFPRENPHDFRWF